MDIHAKREIKIELRLTWIEPEVVCPLSPDANSPLTGESYIYDPYYSTPQDWIRCV